MKKTLVALSVLSAVGAVNAAEVYKNDNVSVSISGTAEVQLLKDWEADKRSDAVSNKSDSNSDAEPAAKLMKKNVSEKDVVEDSDSRFKLDDGDLTMAASVKVSETLSAVGGIGFDLTESKATTDELYVGLSNDDWGTVTFGRQTLISNDDGIGKDYGLGFKQYMSDQIEKDDEVVKYVYDNGKYYFGVSHALRGDALENTPGVDNDGDTSVIDGRVGVRMDDIDARLYVYTDKQSSEGDDAQTQTTAYNLEVEYAFDEALSVAASYGESDLDEGSKDTNKSDSKYAEVTGSYAVNSDTTLALGYVYTDESVSKTETQNIYANVTKQLQDNVKVYAEVGYADEDIKGFHQSIDLAYLAGMKVNF
jgi:predicted porin